MRRGPRASGGAALWLLVLAMAAYVALHSPLRGPLAKLLGLHSRGCYLCLGAPPGVRLVDAVASAALIVAAGAAAWALCARATDVGYERPLAFGLLALSFVVAPAAAIGGLASLFDATWLRPPLGPLLAALPGAVVAIVCIRGTPRPHVPRLPPRVGGTPLLRTALTAAGVLLILQVAVSLIHPATQGDALTYHAPLGVLLWRGGNLTSQLALDPGDNVLAYPATAELWSGALRLIGGERLADLAQLPFAALGAAAVFAFARRTGVLAGAALLAATAFLIIPMVVLQVGTQANDVAGAGLVMTAIALVVAPQAEWDRRRAALVGLALGLAATTKLALLPSVAVAGVLALAMTLQGPVGDRGARTLALAASFLVIVGPWWIRNLVREGNPLYPQTLPLYGHGVNIHDLGPVDTSFVPRPAAWPLYPLLEPIDDRSGFGALLAIAILPGLACAAARARRRPLGIWVLGAVITLPFWWQYTLHEPRFLLAYAGLGLAFLPWALVATRGRLRRRAVLVTACAFAFSAILTIDQEILPLARQPVGRSAFYDRVWGVDPAAVSLPQADGILLVTGFGFPRVDYAALYPLLGRGQRRVVVPIDASELRGSRSAITGRMRRFGISYVYVTAVAARRTEVAALFGGGSFKLVHVSEIVPGAALGARRTVFRPATIGEAGSAIYRFLYRSAQRAS